MVNLSAVAVANKEEQYVSRVDMASSFISSEEDKMLFKLFQRMEFKATR